MDYSTLSEVLTCARKHQYHNIEKLESPEGRMATKFGTLWHRILELHGLGNPDPVAQALVDVKWEDPADDWRTAHKASLGFVRWKERWGERGGWEWLATEFPFGVKIAEEQDEPLEGKIDALVRMDVNQLMTSDEGFGIEKWVVDYKTTSRLESDWVTYYRVSNQFKFYYAAARFMHPDVAGVIVDLYHATKGAKKTGKTDAEREGNNFYRCVFRFDERAIEEAMADFNVGVRTAEWYRMIDYYPKNTSACHQFNSPCPFLDLCDAADPELRQRMKEGFIENTFSIYGDRNGK